jgi:glycosyltransferase involved in cell wall biosynthesis
MAGSSAPAVSVILPVHNGEPYLRFAIDSVLAQTLQDHELIVVDDGSVDATPSIAQSYGPRVRYVRQENTGVAGAVNHGLRLASGRYISWLSHDDIFMPAKLEQQVRALSRLGVPAVCYTDVQTIDARGRVVREQRLPEYGPGDALRHILTVGTICLASYSILYDRRCIEDVGVYSETWRYTQDIDMLARLAQRFALIRVPDVLTQVREHATRGTRSKDWEREVLRYFPERLNSIPIDALFPALGPSATKTARAHAFLWLAHRFASHHCPAFRPLAREQYARALAESPAVWPSLIKQHWVSLFRRHPQLYSLGLRTALARRFKPPSADDKMMGA